MGLMHERIFSIYSPFKICLFNGKNNGAQTNLKINPENIPSCILDGAVCTCNFLYKCCNMCQNIGHLFCKSLFLMQQLTKELHRICGYFVSLKQKIFTFKGDALFLIHVSKQIWLHYPRCSYKLVVI